MQDYFRLTKQDHVARIHFTRADKHNAFDEHLIAALTQCLRDLDEDPAIETVVLSAAGRSFSAGADLDWMKRAAQQDHADNLEDARALAGLMHQLNFMRTTTIAQVQGAAIGGGVGLVACCDIVIASTEARFALSEVKLGLIPSAISPYVIAVIGESHARRYFQTAEIIDAEMACRIGLVHEIVSPDDLADRVEAILAALKLTAPRAREAAKQLVFDVASSHVGSELSEMTARRIADIRTGQEAKEGVSAFFEKRQPVWHYYREGE